MELLDRAHEAGGQARDAVLPKARHRLACPRVKREQPFVRVQENAPVVLDSRQKLADMRTEVDVGRTHGEKRPIQGAWPEVEARIHAVAGRENLEPDIFTVGRGDRVGRGDDPRNHGGRRVEAGPRNAAECE